MAYVYTLYGSEDGLMSAHGSKKAALAAATEYLQGGEEEPVEVHVEDLSGMIFVVTSEHTMASAEVTKLVIER